MSAIHQFVAGLAKGDAISNEAFVMRGIFRGWGFGSDIFSEKRRILPELRDEANDIAGASEACREDDVALLHLSIGSPVNDVFARLKCRKAILYHNITPPQYFRGIQEQTAGLLERGLAQARSLAGAAQVVMADSAFNAAELQAMGYSDVSVLPLLLDLARMRGQPDSGMRGRLDDGLVNVLFVGRGVPNKCLGDVLSAFHNFQKYHQPNSRLVHVGSFDGSERYSGELRLQIRKLGLDNVELFGSLPQGALNACYAAASVFLCMSEHEGFCIPLLEAMAHGVPVLAYGAAAVPETLDGAGVLFREKRFDLVAAMMERLVSDSGLRNAVIAGQRERLARYEKRDLANELRAHLAPVLLS